MPRDSSGVYTLPVGNPVVTNTVITSTWANGTLSDIAAQLNGVLTRDGLLGPTGPFKLQDGTVAAPGLAWASEPGLGWYRGGAKQISMVAGGAESLRFSFTSPNVALTVAPAANGYSQMAFSNQAITNPNSNYVVLTQKADGSAELRTGNNGTALRGPLLLDGAPVQVYSGNLELTYSGATLYFPASAATPDGSGAVVNTFTAQNVLSNWRVAARAAAYPGNVMWQLLIGQPDPTIGYQFNQAGDASKWAGSINWVISSDESLKENISDYTRGLDAILAIRPRSYMRRARGDSDIPRKLEYGIVAQELQGPMPETISVDQDGLLMFDAGPITFALVNAVKTLNTRIAQLENA